MMLPLLAVLLQAPSTPPPPSPSARDEKPVRVWLNPGGPLARGDPVRVYVRTAEDGFLIVVHRGTDGRIRVLFPANPTDDPFVRGGTYEIRSAGDGVATPAGGGGGAAFVVAEPDGRGLVLAAVSPSSFRFDEFVHVADWNPDALAPSWQGADAVGGVTDIVQRMLGDGYFNYDIATYTVAPRAYAQAPVPGAAPQDDAMPPACIGCTFIGSQVVIIEPPLFFDAGLFQRHALQCDQSASCPDPGGGGAGGAASAMALPSRYRVTANGALQRRNATFVPPRLPVATPSIGPRRRSPVSRDLPAAPAPGSVRAIPLGPGRQLARGHVSPPHPVMSAPRGQAVAGSWAPPPAAEPPPYTRQVRLTMSPIPVREAAPAPSGTAAAVPVNLNTRRVLVAAAAERVTASQADRPEVSVTAMSRPLAIPQVVVRGTRSGATGATALVGAVGEGGGGGTQTQAVGRPMAAWRGAPPRSAVVAAGARRH